jgi:hypothetical protein
MFCLLSHIFHLFGWCRRNGNIVRLSYWRSLINEISICNFLQDIISCCWKTLSSENYLGFREVGGYIEGRRVVNLLIDWVMVIACNTLWYCIPTHRLQHNSIGSTFPANSIAVTHQGEVIYACGRRVWRRCMCASMGSELIHFVEVINSCLSGNYYNKYSEAKSNITNIIRYFEDERERTDIGTWEWMEIVWIPTE